MWPHSPPAHSRPDSSWEEGGECWEAYGFARVRLPPINHKGKDMVRPRGLVVLTMATLIAFACGSTSGGGGAKGAIKIGSDLPTCTAGGKSTQNGIDYAIKQKNAAGDVSGFTIQFVPVEDCRQAAYSADAGVAHV